MDTGLDLRPVPAHQRHARWTDVALLFAGANVVSTTLVTGGSLGVAASWSTVLVAVVGGVVLGTVPIAILARLGPRFGLPSMVLLRWVFGRLGGAGVAAILVLTNFAWIALNNVIAASALERLTGGSATLWSLTVGLIAVAVAATGPRAMALFDRVAVPLMAAIGIWLTVRLLQMGAPETVASTAQAAALSPLRALDVVVGYQVSWSLMFADYSRYQRREGRASLAVLLGLTLSSAWLMLVGARSAQIGGGSDPSEMILGLGLPVAALAVVVLSTVTTNFVNLYLSSLAVKSLWPRAPALPTVLAIGAVGTAFALLSPDLLDSYASFMGILGTLLLPIVAVTLVHFFLLPDGEQRRGKDAAATGEVTIAQPPRLRLNAVLSWGVGVLTHRLLAASTVAEHWPLGATVPTLVLTAGVYLVSSLVLRPGADWRP